MGTGSTASEVERLRQRLNSIVLVLPGQWLPITAAYWIRFLPPLRPFDLIVPEHAGVVFAAAVLAGVLPFLLPRAWFRPRAFERGGFYPALGVRIFRRLATDGDWVLRSLRRRDPAYRIVRDRATRAAHLAGGITNERWHSAWFLFGAVSQTFAFATGEYGWGTLMTVLNAAFNLFPVLHQRHKRARLRQPLDVALATTMPTVGSTSARRPPSPTPRS